MTTTGVPAVLVTGATGRVGRAVVGQLVDAGVPVRALTRRPEAAALPENVEVVAGDLTVPGSLDPALRGIDAVFLVWTVPPTTAPAVIKRLATHTRRVVFLSSPHQTPHPFFQQPNPMALLHAGIFRGAGHPRNVANLPPVGRRSRRRVHGSSGGRLTRESHALKSG